MSIVQELSITDPRLNISASECEDITELDIWFTNTPTLVTHLGFIVKDLETANRTFKLVGVESKRQEADDFTQLYDYEVQGHDYSLDFQNKGSIVLVPALGLSHATRLSFECEKDPEDFDNEVAAISQRIHWASIAFSQTYASIALIGFPLNSNPTASHVVTLLNAASYLRNCFEGIDADYLAGLALMNARRFMQAAEFIRRAESRLIGNFNMPVQQSLRNNVSSRSPTATSNQKMLRAAKLELLVGEGFNQHGQILDKLIAYERATELFLGGFSIDAVQLDCDVYSSLLLLQPHLGKLLLSNLHDKLEPLRVACVRGLDFLLEHLGCSLGNQFILLLKTVIKSYPIGVSCQSDSLSTSLMSGTSVADLSLKDEVSPMLVDSYNRLLETCLNTLSSCSPQLLHCVFYEVLSHNVLLPEFPVDLKNYLLKLTEKITAICEGDLVFSNNLLSGITAMKGGEDTADNALRLWELVKSKVLVHYTGNRLFNLISWLKNLLANESECIDIVLDVISNLTASDNGCGSMLGPRNRSELALFVPILAELLEFATGHIERFKLFETTWGCLVRIAEQIPDLSLVKLVLPLLGRTEEFIADYSPPLNMLKVLELVLSSLKLDQELCDFLLSFLPVFCDTVPNNVHDEAFYILNTVLSLVGGLFAASHLRKLIDTILDQYTVKSQSQKHSKTYLISLIKTSAEYIDIVIDYCLLHNKEPLLDESKYGRQRIIQEHDCFNEKIAFVIEVLALIEEEHAGLISSKIEEIALASAELLRSRNSHVRIRGLEVLRLLGEACIATADQDPFFVAPQLLQVIAQTSHLAQDPKINFFSLQLIDLIFKHIVPSKISDKTYQETRCVEVLQIWTRIAGHIESPWSNIRAVALSILCSCIQINLGDLRPQLQHKVKSLVLPLILSLLSSKDSGSRAGGLNLLGSYCGLSVSNEHSTLEKFQPQTRSIPLAIWEQVFHLQDDWDPVIRDASTVLIQVSGPRDSIKQFYQLQREEYSLRFAALLNLEEESFNEEPTFWVDSYSSEEVLELISMFKNDSKNPEQLWNEYREPREEEYLEEPKNTEGKIEDEPETLEDLGIIEVDDEVFEDDEFYPIIKNSYSKKKHTK